MSTSHAQIKTLLIRDAVRYVYLAIGNSSHRTAVICSPARTGRVSTHLGEKVQVALARRLGSQAVGYSGVENICGGEGLVGQRK